MLTKHSFYQQLSFGLKAISFFQTQLKLTRAAVNDWTDLATCCVTEKCWCFECNLDRLSVCSWNR